MPATTLTPDQVRTVARTRKRLEAEGAKALRQSMRLSVWEFSHALHTTPDVIRRWEKLGATPTIKFILRIAELLDAVERP